jgi:hypothetical protein
MKVCRRITFNSAHRIFNPAWSDDKNLEKFAREEHLMKRDDEDVFIFVEKKNK